MYTTPRWATGARAKVRPTMITVYTRISVAVLRKVATTGIIGTLAAS